MNKNNSIALSNGENGESQDISIKNKNLIQSYIFTTSRYDFSVHEKRILYRLIEVAQAQIEGHSFGNGGCVKIEPELFGKRQVFTFKTSAFLHNEDDENYSKIKKAFHNLSVKMLSYEDNDTWRETPIVAYPTIEKRSSLISFEVDHRIWECILDYSSGFRKYEMKIAWSFKSAFSMRFYELMSGQKKPLTYFITTLKDMFGVADKYSRTNDFIKRVIVPAKKELDEYSPYTFTYKTNKDGKAITSITFFPVFQAKNADPELEKKETERMASLRWDLDKRVLDYLRNVMEWKENSIKNNRDLLVMAQNSIPDFLNVLAELHGKSRNLKSPAGYVVNALRGKLNDMMANNR